mgnify:CR=1 FL=1
MKIDNLQEAYENLQELYDDLKEIRKKLANNPAKYDSFKHEIIKFVKNCKIVEEKVDDKFKIIFKNLDKNLDDFKMELNLDELDDDISGGKFDSQSDKFFECLKSKLTPESIKTIFPHLYKDIIELRKTKNHI